MIFDKPMLAKKNVKTGTLTKYNITWGFWFDMTSLIFNIIYRQSMPSYKKILLYMEDRSIDQGWGVKHTNSVVPTVRAHIFKNVCFLQKVHNAPAWKSEIICWTCLERQTKISEPCNNPLWQKSNQLGATKTEGEY